MEPGTWIALGAVLVAFGALALNYVRDRRERRSTQRVAGAAAVKAVAERDSLAMHSAEQALHMMEKMMQTAVASEDRLKRQADLIEQKFNECVRRLERCCGSAVHENVR